MQISLSHDMTFLVSQQTLKGLFISFLALFPSAVPICSCSCKPYILMPQTWNQLGQAQTSSIKLQLRVNTNCCWKLNSELVYSRNHYWHVLCMKLQTHILKSKGNYYSSSMSYACLLRAGGLVLNALGCVYGWSAHTLNSLQNCH